MTRTGCIVSDIARGHDFKLLCDQLLIIVSAVLMSADFSKKVSAGVV